MALDRTSGFDMLVQISETELNSQLETAFLAGTIFPPAISVPITSGGVSGRAELNFDTPIADLDRPRPRMGLTLPFAESQLEITAPLPLTVSPLGGDITIVDSIVMRSEGGTQIASMDFTDGAPDVSVEFDSDSASRLAPLLAAAGLSINQAQNMMAGIVLQQLQNEIQQMDLTPPIPVTDDADATTVFDIDVTTVNDTSAVDRDCLAFGIRMASDSGGNINGVTTSMIPGGSGSLVMMSNFWLLARVMRPRLATQLGIPLSNFDTPLRLNSSVPAPGGDGTLTNLEARVVGNRIAVTGRATDSGTGWSAVSNFSFFIDIGLSGGDITITATEPNVDTDVDLEWWVWLVSLGLGGLFGGIIGAIVAAIVLAIVEAVAEGIANGLVSDGLSGSLGGLPSVPLGPIGSGLTLTNIVLDDLELRSSIIRAPVVPVKHQGQHVDQSAFALDLDTGDVSNDIRAGTDLVWRPNQGLSTKGGSGLSITGIAYGALTPVQVSHMSLSTTQVSPGAIPMTFPPSFWFMPHQSVVFGVRTSEGRLAKVKAWRSLVEGGALHIRWTTFDTPIPSLDIKEKWSILERGEVEKYISPDCSYCRSGPVRRCGVFEAWPKLAAFPVDYQWCLCGEILEQGFGEIPTKHGPLAYKLTGRRLHIETDMGQSVNCELCVSAIDAHGKELYTCIRIKKPGIDKKCRKCTPGKSLVQLEVRQPSPELLTWRPLLEQVTTADAAAVEQTVR